VRRLALLPLLCALLVATGCGRADPDPAEATPAPPPSDVVIDLPAACEEPGSCDLGYRAFISLAPGPLRRLHPLDLEALIEPTRSAAPLPPSAPLPPDELRRKVLEGTRIDGIVPTLAERLPEGSVRGIEPIEGGHRLTLRFDDVWVGGFDAVLLLPVGPGPHPAIVVHPGHSERPDDHLELRFGRALPEAGIAVLLLDPRVHESDDAAAQLTEDLLLQGLTLVGLRLYEVLAAKGWLAARADIDGGRIALGGHSGGALVANLGVRADPNVAALLTDLTSGYLNVDDGAWQDESAPDLWPLQEVLADLSTTGVPALRMPYGYPGGDAQVLPFLREALAVQ
jgi:hypothetical protein